MTPNNTCTCINCLVTFTLFIVACFVPALDKYPTRRNETYSHLALQSEHSVQVNCFVATQDQLGGGAIEINTDHTNNTCHENELPRLFDCTRS
jgi:hypothetical protein